MSLSNLVDNNSANDFVENNMKEEILMQSGAYNVNEAFAFTSENIFRCWSVLLLTIIVFAVLSVILLEFIDRDRR